MLNAQAKKRTVSTVDVHSSTSCCHLHDQRSLHSHGHLSIDTTLCLINYAAQAYTAAAGGWPAGHCRLACGIAAVELMLHYF